jgi:hypothetical protein
MDKLKDQLSILEKKFEDEVGENAEKIKQLDLNISQILGIQKDDIVRLNIGGKKFTTTIKTLMSVPDTIFYKVIITKTLDTKKEIFIDRSPELFHYLLDYLRYKKFNYARFTLEELKLLKEESEYYEILPLETYLAEVAKEKTIIKVEVSAYYYEGTNIVGTQDHNVLSDKNLNTGICTVHNGWFMAELNFEHWVEEIEIGGYIGKSDWVYPAGYGSGAAITVSTDKKTWVSVGAIPSGFGQNILKFKVVRSKAKYIKFAGQVYFGIGYLKFL